MKHIACLPAVIGIIFMTLGFVQIVKAATEGPSVGDLKAAMRDMGIQTGAHFQFGGKVYTLRNLSVSKSGPESFNISLTTASE